MCVAGGGATALTVAELDAEPVLVPPVAVPVAAADNVKVSPVGALPGMAISACSWVDWPLGMVPSVQVWVPAPFPHTVKVGAGAADEEICAVTPSASPPLALTVML